LHQQLGEDCFDGTGGDGDKTMSLIQFSMTGTSLLHSVGTTTTTSRNKYTHTRRALVRAHAAYTRPTINQLSDTVIPGAYLGGRLCGVRLQLRFDFDSTGVQRAFDYLSKVVKVTVT